MPANINNVENVFLHIQYFYFAGFSSGTFSWNAWDAQFKIEGIGRGGLKQKIHKSNNVYCQENYDSIR